MSSGRRKFVLRHPVVVDVGCSCRRPKLLPSFLSSSRKTKTCKTPSSFSPSTSANTTTSSLWEASITAATTPTTSSPSRYDYVSSSTFSAPQSPTSTRRSHRRNDKEDKPTTTTMTTTQNNAKMTTTTTTAKKKEKGVVEESVAVVKESSDPYADFRDSMLQMIVEMDIYAWEDLRDLLHRFLALNDPHHHHLIFCAFAEIWHALFSAPTPSSSSSNG